MKEKEKQKQKRKERTKRKRENERKKRNERRLFSFLLDTLQGKVAEFLESNISVPFVEFCQGGIFFTGKLIFFFFF